MPDPRPTPRVPRSLAALFVLAAAATIAPAGAAAPPADPQPVRTVVVLGGEGSTARVRAAVHGAGGRTTRPLPSLDGVVARVPEGHVADLRAAPGVRSVTPDRALQVRSAAPGAGASAAHVRTVIDAGGLGGGAGVDVALVDTGVAPVASLAGRVVDGIDLSADAEEHGRRGIDAHGHGTHLAGIIAGVAPNARVVDVKVADRDGETTLSRVLAGIDWVIRHGRSKPLDVRVLNLSLGAEAAGGYAGDPLAVAVERAWRSGVVVVASAGNGGAEAATLDSPAHDPFVIAAGAADTAGTDDLSDDVVAAFSSAGSGARPPDVVAPGVGVLGPHVPGSLLDQTFPGARAGDDAMRGSGTSQAAAVVSGAAALVLGHRGWLSPDALKAVLRAAARPLGAPGRHEGTGMVRAAGAVTAPVPRGHRQHHHPATGGGAGTVPVVALAPGDPEPTATRWTATRWTATRWTATGWTATRWTADGWTAASE